MWSVEFESLRCGRDWATRRRRTSVSFSAAGDAVLAYVADGIPVTKRIVPMAFGPGGPPACRLEPGNHAADDNFQGQWWNPAQPGWGVTIADQGGVLFAVLFVYDASGAPMWLVAPAAARNADGGYSGALYRTSQPPSAGSSPARSIRSS